MGAMPVATQDFPQPAGDIVVQNGEAYESSRDSRDSQEGTLNDSCAPLTPLEKEQEQLLIPINRGAPGDAALTNMVKRGPVEIMQSKRKSQFYGEVFAYREPQTSARDRITRDAIVTAEFKTNVIIDDEYTFLTSLSAFLSQRYQRPQSSILISLSHSACLLLGGSFDPAYHLTISAVPVLVQSTLNKRNAALTQSFLADILNVPASRGILRFEAVPEENLATNGMTVLAEIDSLSKGSPPQHEGLGRKRTRKHKDSGPKDVPLRPRSPKSPIAEQPLPSETPKPGQQKQQPPSPTDGGPKDVLTQLAHKGSMLRGRSKSAAAVRERGPEVRPAELPPVPASPAPRSPIDVQAEKVQKMGKRRSFMQMFGR